MYKRQAYYCFCDKERLESLKTEVTEGGAEIVVYDKMCIRDRFIGDESYQKKLWRFGSVKRYLFDSKKRRSRRNHRTFRFGEILSLIHI